MKYVKIDGIISYFRSFKNFDLGKKGKRVESLVDLMLNKIIPTLKTTIVTVDLNELYKTPSFNTKDFKNNEKKRMKAILHLLDSYGLIGVYKLEDNKLRCVLTYLGEKVFKFINELELSSYEKVSLLLISGLLFKTKARIIALSALSGLSNLRELYNSVSAKFFGENLKGCERVAYEILEEIHFIGGGVVGNYITSTQIALCGLSYLGLINLSNSFNEFEINLEGKFISPSDFLALDLEVTNGDYMGFGIRSDIKPSSLEEMMKKLQRRRKYKYGNELPRLIEMLKEEKERIETNLRRFYSLPFSY